MYERILLGTDGSEGSEGAVRHALALATALDATLHVLSVVERPDETVGDEAAGEADEPLLRIEAAERAAAAVARRGRAHDLTVETTVERGVPYRRILDHAAAADLVVVGRHGAGGLREFVLGSTAERVVRRARVPVVTPATTTDPQPTYETVVLGVDGSVGSEAAVEPAVALAAATGATVHVVSAVETDVFDPTVVVDLLGGLESLAEDLVAGVADDVAAAADVPVETSVERGAAAGALRRYASRVDADLVVLGATGATGLEASLLGSTTAKVLRAGDHAVVTVPRPGPETPQPSV
jgi:nucleotide-binding universal stress UspA family protein